MFGSKLDLTVENPLLAVKLRNNCYNCNVAKQTLCYDISIVEKKNGDFRANINFFGLQSWHHVVLRILIFLDYNHGIMWFCGTA